MLLSHKADTEQAAAIRRPRVRLEGAIDHRDFKDMLELLRADADVSHTGPPDLIVLAQDRPGVIAAQQAEAWQREAPLAGMIAVAGSWCEGETRTGRPLAGVLRLYWHEFPTWWRRQIARRASRLCPDWAQPANYGVVVQPIGNSRWALQTSQVVALSVTQFETADALADLFQVGGYATVWAPPASGGVVVRGLAAGVWEGGQLDETESLSLARFCRRMANESAPVVALLDFPRRDAVDRALEIGAASVLGKPCRNADLIDAMRQAIERRSTAPARITPARAA
jgi:hypothetical protein